MALWLWLVVFLAAFVVAAAIAASLLWRSQPPESRVVASRVMRLSWRNKARLVWRLLREPRVPLWARALIPAVALYLAMPLDVIPDFIPVVGHLDDLVVVALVGGVLLRSVPNSVIEEHLARLELGAASEQRRAAKD